MIIKIADNYINLDNVKWMVPVKRGESKYLLRIEFNPSGHIEIGNFSSLIDLHTSIKNAEVIEFNTKS